MRPILAAGVLLVAAAAPYSHASCQETGAAQDVTVYSREHFSRAQPTTAYDMVLLIPGFRLVEGDTERRGFAGSAGNVLIDNERPTSKEETLEALLKRIPADRIERIDLIRGGAAGYDMQGHVQLVNLVRKAASRASGRLEAQNAIGGPGRTSPRLSAGATFGSGKTSVDLAATLYREIDDEHGVGRRDRFDEDGAALRLAKYSQIEGTEAAEVSGNVRQELLGGTMTLTSLVKDGRTFADFDSSVTLPGIGRVIASERGANRTYDGSIRFARSIGAGNQLEAIVSFRSEQQSGHDTEKSGSGTNRTDEHARASEWIARIAIRRNLAGWTVEAGGEGALNSLASTNLLFVDETPVPLPAASARVSEKRFELFASASRELRPSLSLEGSLRYEASRLTQRTADVFTKSLAFAKPRLNLQWTTSSTSRVTLLAEREVGQLEFKNFVGTASVIAGTVTAGNRDLEPETLWRAQITFEQKLGAGALTLQARREWLSNVVDRFPLFANGVVFDAVGNIGKGLRDEIEADFALPLDDLGAAGLTLKAHLIARRSDVVDPTTGEIRTISEDVPFDATTSITHDMPRWKLRWGLDYSFAKMDTSYRVREIQTDSIGERVSAFAEFKPAPQWTIRAFGRNLTDSAANRVREIYASPRNSGSLGYRELRSLRAGPFIGMSVQRTFGG